MKTTNTTNHPPLSTIRKAFQALRGVFYSNSIQWADTLADECAQEERRHRGTNGEFANYHPKAASVADCARAFAVLRVAQYLSGERFPSGKDYLHFQRSCFTAAGMADEFKEQILQAWQPFNMDELLAIDYCRLVGTPED